VLGAVTTTHSGRVLVIPVDIGADVVIEIPAPLDVHDKYAAKRSVAFSRRAVLKEGTAGRVKPGHSSETTVCRCRSCVAEIPGYLEAEGCGHLVPAMRCGVLRKRYVQPSEPFVPEDPQRFQLLFRLLNAFFIPLPSKWTWLAPLGGKLDMNYPGRVLLDATNQNGDRKGTPLSSNCEELEFDIPALDVGTEQLQSLLVRMADFVGPSTKAEIMPNKRQLIHFLSFFARTAGHFPNVTRYNEERLYFGSIVFEQMLRRSLDMCSSLLRSDWSKYPHRFLMLEDGMTLRLLTPGTMFGGEQAHFRGHRGSLFPEYSLEKKEGDEQVSVPAKIRHVRLDPAKEFGVAAASPEHLQGANPELARQLAMGLDVDLKKLKGILQKNRYILIFDVRCL
jgi:hypothetical protein